jgi:glyceraldehyde 3-phosphate dehydrogenase
MASINVGINGLGRIGKCCLLQMIDDVNVTIRAVNINNLEIDDLEQYLNSDTIHGRRYMSVVVIDTQHVLINNNPVFIFKTKDVAELDWKSHHVDYLFETTGAYLTQESAGKHDVDYVCMSAPPKDLGSTPIFCYGVNEDEYNGERFISNASCTTNCIAPFLKILEKYDIISSNFITIHSATSSQSVVDTANFNKRTNRSIFNNIIPHTTGATSSLKYILPNLENKIVGTSVRIPTSNVSMVDINVTFSKEIQKEVVLDDLCKLENEVVAVNKKKLVSTDFIGTTHPTIVDYHSTFQIDPNSIKFTLWYDNEWSYSAQMIKMVKTMFNKNNMMFLNKVTNVNCFDKIVFVRCDFNCPVNDANEIQDDYRIRMALPTIHKILLDGPKKVVLMTHFGRPKNIDGNYSTSLFIDKLTEYLNMPVAFLKYGLQTREEELFETDHVVYLMENLRFHNYETNYKGGEQMNRLFITPDVYCNEAFSVSHRDHFSITQINAKQHCFGKCFSDEINSFNLILKNNGSNVTAIIGGSKVSDKMPMLEKLSTIVDVIFVAGNNLNSVSQNKEFFEKISKNKARVVYACDGMGGEDPNDTPTYVENIMDKKENVSVFDIGPKSMNMLVNCIYASDIVFWNGTLGITEHDFYKNSSETLVGILNNCQAKVIIGGGDTAGFVKDYKNNFHHISTGGGASIEYISHGTLAGIKY